MPSRDQHALLWQEVALAREDANPQFSLKNLDCRRFQGRLHLVRPGLTPRHEQLAVTIGESVVLPDGLGRVQVSARPDGEGLR